MTGMFPMVLVMGSLLAGRVQPDVEVRRISLPTGVTLEFADRGASAAKVVMMLHGYTDSRQSFDRLVPLLPAEFRLIAVDLRGHGGSSRPGHGYSIGAMASDIVALIAALGLNDVTLVGHSMGSFVAREVARRLPSRVTGLILIGSAPIVRNAVTVGLRAEVQRLGDSIPEAFVRAFQLGTVSRPLPERFLGEVIEASRRTPAFVWREALDGQLAWDDRDRLGNMMLPVLLLWGSEDAIFPAPERTGLFRRLRMAEARVYAGVGHAPHWEVPDLVASDIRDFLRRHHAFVPEEDER